MKTVLIVDDFSSLRAATHFALKLASYQVIEACNGKEALEILKNTSRKIDLIVTDMNMPVMNGLEFIKTLRQDSKYKFMPVIALSTQAKEEETKKAGVTAYIHKPFNTSQFIQIVKKLLK